MQPKSKMYACFAFFPDGSVKKWKYVRNLKSFGEFLSKTHPLWKYFNVYDKGTRAFLKRFYPGNLVPKVLGLFLLIPIKFTFALSCCFPKSITYENTFDKATFNKATFINGFNNSATIPTLLNHKGGSL